MNDHLIDILPIFLLALIVFNAHLIRPKYLFNNEYLSTDTGKNYRGFFALVIVLHHLAQSTETGIIFRYFVMVGYLVVAFFFFLSGYGLQKSYITKKESYKKGFILKRLPTILIPYIIIAFCYWLRSGFGGKYYSLKELIVDIWNGRLIVTYSWYIANILLFYILFWLLMVICKRHYFFMILGGIVGYILYVAFCVKQGYGNWWYNVSLILVMGMSWATYEEKIIKFVRKRYFVISPIVLLIFIAFFCFDLSGRITHFTNNFYIINIIPKLISAVFFVIGVILFSMKIQIGNVLLDFLGEISLEIYISQGLFMNIFRKENELFWCVGVLLGTVLFSFFFHVALKPLLKKYKLLLTKVGIIN